MLRSISVFLSDAGQVPIAYRWTLVSAVGIGRVHQVFQGAQARVNTKRMKVKLRGKIQVDGKTYIAYALARPRLVEATPRVYVSATDGVHNSENFPRCISSDSTTHAPSPFSGFLQFPVTSRQISGCTALNGQKDFSITRNQGRPKQKK